MSDVHKILPYLFIRPCEPMITPKGDDRALFQLTPQFLAEPYVGNGIDLNNRFGEDAGQIIPLHDLKKVPDLTKSKKVPTNVDLSLFLGPHIEAATEVIDVLMAVPENDLQQFLSTCVYCRVNLNPQLFNYAFSVALMHRDDTKNVPILNYAEIFPSKFVDSLVFYQARRMTTVVPKDTARQPITIPRDYTATDADPEHRLAYFREDIGVNLHHWHWHLVYPYAGSDRSIVDKDRRGELFFFMHQQIMARYNCERLNIAMKRVKQFSDWRAPIPEAYFPKLDSLTSSRAWPSRQMNMRWQDLNRPADSVRITIDDMENWRKHLEEAISTGSVKLPNGSTMPLDINTLGNMVEASSLSPNRQYYGSVHNNGHVFASYVHDPDNRFLESFAVMGDVAITMRDPFFYCWHAWIAALFERYKESPYVRAYTNSELVYQGIRIISAIVQSSTGQQNVFNTFWMQSDVDLSRGLDFSKQGPVYARFTHLNHRPFQYTIKVHNDRTSRRGTVRIFIAPKFDERNQPWGFNDQRKIFIEMDRFVVSLKAGENTITRKSTDSTLTIPFEQTFRDLSPQGSDPSRPQVQAFNFCGCGWPQHMLVPRGSESGVSYQLFIMVSDYELDRVEQPGKRNEEVTCVEASIFCGLKNQLYPDKRPMGFPFDRPSKTASTIKEFIKPNMALVDCSIRLQNVTELNPKNPKLPQQNSTQNKQ